METIKLELIDGNPYQTRAGADQQHIEALAEDIWKNSLLQYPVGRRVGERVQLAFGHNRLAAFKRLKIQDPDIYSVMPVELRMLSDVQMALLAWSENEKRQQLSPLERSHAIKRMMESFSWTQQETAEKLDMARSTLANMLRLLNLPKPVQDSLNQGVISQRQAMALLPIYELHSRDIHWMSQDPGRAEFLRLAREGAFDSDTIRERVNEYQQALEDSKPKQLTIDEKPEAPAPAAPPEEEPAKTQPVDDRVRPLVKPAIDYVGNMANVRVTDLQRHFRIGWSTAVRLVEELQKWDALGEKLPETHYYPVLVGKYAPKVDPGAPPPPSPPPAEERGEGESPTDLVRDVGVQTPHEEQTPAPAPKPAPTPGPSPERRGGKAKAPEPKPEPVPVPEPEKLTVTITWMDGSVILAAQRSGGDKPGQPLFKVFGSLPLYEVALKLGSVLPEDLKELIK